MGKATEGRLLAGAHFHVYAADFPFTWPAATGPRSRWPCSALRALAVRRSSNIFPPPALGIWAKVRRAVFEAASASMFSGTYATDDLSNPSQAA